MNSLALVVVEAVLVLYQSLEVHLLNREFGLPLPGFLEDRLQPCSLGRIILPESIVNFWKSLHG